MRPVSFYDATSGIFSAGAILVADDQATASLIPPAGCVALDGNYDALSQKVDIPTGTVVPYIPASPGADYVWDVPTLRWILSPTAQAAANAKAAVLVAIAQLEAGQGRALREAAIGTPGAVARLQAIDAQIEALRPTLTATS